jgi:hypothetical protein
MISPENMVGFGEAQKVAYLNKVFTDSYKSPLSVVVVDNIERILGTSSLTLPYSLSVLGSTVPSPKNAWRSTDRFSVRIRLSRLGSVGSPVLEQRTASSTRLDQQASAQGTSSPPHSTFCIDSFPSFSA